MWVRRFERSTLCYVETVVSFCKARFYGSVKRHHPAPFSNVCFSRIPFSLHKRVKRHHPAPFSNVCFPGFLFLSLKRVKRHAAPFSNVCFSRIPFPLLKASKETSNSIFECWKGDNVPTIGINTCRLGKEFQNRQTPKIII